MPSYPGYKNDFRKNSTKDDLFVKPKNMTKHEEFEWEKREQYKKWITFYRRNPHRFIEEYFGIKLFPYQILMIWVLQRSNLAYIVASRAAAKTFIIAVWSLTLAVLYPGIKVVVCAKTLKQGAILLSEKMTALRDTHPNVAREIKSITTNNNENLCVFHCGSTIKVVPSSESARGQRANYIVVEEARLVPKDILEQIIKPFLFVRMPPFRLKREYEDYNNLLEEGIISYITSAWYTAEYWYTYVKSCVRKMNEGDETSNFLAFDYLISVFHNIKSERTIKNEMADNDAVSVQMEYLNIPSGASGKSYYKPSMFNRSLKKAFYPQKENTYNAKKNPYEIKWLVGEKRMVTIDVATRANKANDQTIISCIRLIPLMGKGYERQLVYMESHKGVNVLDQAKRIKEIYFDFMGEEPESGMLVLDLAQAGISIFDSLTQPTLSDERGLMFPPLTVSNDDFIDEKTAKELRDRTLGINPLPVIYPITANQVLNSQIAVAFRSSLQKKLWHFLISDNEAEDFLLKTNREFTDSTDSESWGFFLNPYVQTNLFIGECINLDMILTNGLIKLVEKVGAYKDRYTSVSYGNWIINHLDKSLLKQTENVNDWDAVRSVTLVY